MKISSISTYSMRAKNAMTKPSFGEVINKSGSWEDDVYLETKTERMEEDPKQFIKELTYGSINRQPEALFGVAIELRARERQKEDKSEELVELKVKKIHAHMIEQDIWDAHDPTGGERRHQYLAKVKEAKEFYETRISELTKISRDEKKIERYKTIGQLLAEQPWFNPNKKVGNTTLIETAVRVKDFDMAKIIMKHKNYKRPENFANEEDRLTYEYFEKKIKKGFLGIF